MEQILSAIAEKLADAAGLPAAAFASLFEEPRDRKMGDVALPCFRLAKELKKKPPEIASDLAAKLSAAGPPVASAKAAGPYLNIMLDRAALAEAVLGELKDSADGLPPARPGAGKKAVIEFSSPNIAKPFTVALLRGTALGAALARVHEALGYEVVRCNYLGDWGTQFGKVITAFRKWGDEKKLEKDAISHLLELYVRFDGEAKKDASLAEEARATFRKLEEGSAEEAALWKRFRALSLGVFEKTYARLGIRFDSYEGEAHYRSRVPEAVKTLKACGLLEESRGATIVDLEKHGLGVMIVLKSDDASIYASRDVAAALDRADCHGFDRLVYVVGADQKLHFRQLFKVLELAGCAWAGRCRHVDFGLVLVEGEKMSTRAGRIVLLRDLLDRASQLAREVIAQKNPDLADPAGTAEAVGVGAVLFASLFTRRNKDVDFAWKRILSFEGETGPYLQYTHARLCSILRKAGGLPAGAADVGLLSTDEEHAVVKQLGRMGPLLSKTAEDGEPALLAAWLLDLCGAANNFYNRHRVLGEEPVNAARLLLVDCVRKRLSAGLSILGIVPLEEM
ncbi:MAG: arginine--tRNA ligase [Planctomycetota bacterium]